MEFWGVEVKPKEVLKCNPGDDKYLHISQVALGEIKNAKGNERITLYVHVDDKKVVIGSLVYGKSDQFSLDLVFEREFKLSHSCTTGSVFFSGYTTLTDGGDDAMGGFDGTDSDSEDEQQAQALVSQVKENVARLVKPEAKKDGTKSAKPAATTGKEGAKAKTKVKPVSAPKPGVNEESSDEEEDDEDEDEDMEAESDDSEAESDDSEAENDEKEDKKNPKAAGKKKSYPDSATRSPGTSKKAKTNLPSGAQRPGADEGKKNGSKAPGVTFAPTSKEQKGQTPKVKGTTGSKEALKTPTTPGSEKKIGEHPCTPCGKIFKTESALSQHNIAKHGNK